jgi:hypothetical protein
MNYSLDLQSVKIFFSIYVYCYTMQLLHCHVNALLDFPSWSVLNSINHYLHNLFSLSDLLFMHDIFIMHEKFFLHLCVMLPTSFSFATFSYFSFLLANLNYLDSLTFYFFLEPFCFLFSFLLTFIFLPLLPILHYDTSYMVHVLCNCPSPQKEDHPYTISTNYH